MENGQQSYPGEFTISYGNTAPNGLKTVTVRISNVSGEDVTSSVQVELQNPDPVLDQNPPDDSFNDFKPEHKEVELFSRWRRL